jgi:hypothetical protein
MAMYGVDCEESTLGQDVAKDSRSYFGHLLNQGLCWGGYRTVPVSAVDGMVFPFGRILVPCPLFGLMRAKKAFLVNFVTENVLFFVLFFQGVYKEIFKQITGFVALFIFQSVVDGSQRVLKDL